MNKDFNDFMEEEMTKRTLRTIPDGKRGLMRDLLGLAFLAGKNKELLNNL